MRKIDLGHFKGDLQGGFVAGVLNLFQCIPYGLIAFAPLGDSYANFGIISCIIASVVAGFFASIAQISGVFFLASSSYKSISFSIRISKFFEELQTAAKCAVA